jgi:diadenosine tetraphosphate (Ap4A) HIT family hydrolase/predicted kinase
MSPERPTPLLVAMRGLPGIGKSVLARAISLEFGWPVLDKDDIKDVVYGRAEAPDRLAYDLQFRLARRQLQQGLSVVCDSPMLHPGVYALAAQAADAAGARLVVLECVLGDAAEHRRRIEVRGSSERVREWAINDWDAFVEFRDRTRPHANYEINVPRHVVDLSQPAAQATRDAVRWLRGRMEEPSPWMAREQWDALVRGDDCPLCGDIASTATENAYGFFVGDLRMSRLMLAREFHVPGRCVLMCRRHVREPHELSTIEQHTFFDDMLRVGKILEQVHAAVKMNYQILGNAVPHLHVHIQPRYFGDPFPGQPVGGPPRQPVILSDVEYRQQVEAIRAALELDSNRPG